MKLNTLFVIAAAALVAVGCKQENRDGQNDTAFKQEKDAIQQSAKDAKEEVERQAKAQKDMLDAEAKSAQAKIDAEKARAKADSANADAKVDAASQSIQEAAGAASSKAQTQTGASQSESTPSVTPVPASPTPNPSTAPAGTTPETTPPASSTATTDDSKLKQQIQDALKSSTAQPNGDSANALQVEVSGGNVTLKGSVKDSEEKSRVEAQVRNVQGVKKIDNQLEVKAQ